jgi:hypothetical protein
MTNETDARRIGLAGAGWVAPRHLQAWQRLRGRAAVVAIADPNVEAARARAKAFGLPAVYPSVEAMLERERMNLDAIDVATPRETHAPICRLAADRGLAIICQKPLAPTFAEAASLVADVGGRVRLMVHDNWRFRPHYRRIGRWLREGRVGEIRTVTMALFTSGLIADASGRAPRSIVSPVRGARAAARHGGADPPRRHAPLSAQAAHAGGRLAGRSPARAARIASIFAATAAAAVAHR